MLELEIAPEGPFSNAHSRMGWMADDSQPNKRGNIIRDVCYTSMPTALNVQEKRIHPRPAPCCSLSQLPAVPPHDAAKQQAHCHVKTRAHTGQE